MLKGSETQVWQRFVFCSHTQRGVCGGEGSSGILLKGGEGLCLLGLDSSHIQDKGKCQDAVCGCGNLAMLGL